MVDYPLIETESGFVPEMHYWKIVRKWWTDIEPEEGSDIHVFDDLPELVSKVLREIVVCWNRPDAFYVTQFQQDNITIEQRRFFPPWEAGRLSRRFWQEGKRVEEFHFYKDEEEWHEGYR